MFYVDYSMRNAIIKQHGLTNKAKKIVERMNIEPGINGAKYKMPKIE